MYNKRTKKKYKFQIWILLLVCIYGEEKNINIMSYDRKMKLNNKLHTIKNEKILSSYIKFMKTNKQTIISSN